MSANSFIFLHGDPRKKICRLFFYLIPFSTKQHTSSELQPAPEIPQQQPKKTNHVPLAEKMRPTSLLGYIGQSHIMGKRSMLLQLLEKGEVPNIILWGPPGCGKVCFFLNVQQIQ